MASKKKQEYEFRYYEIPQGGQVLALLGESWIREYGSDVNKLHFHNLLEVGYCIEGKGTLILGNQSIPYSSGMLTVIPRNCPHHTQSLPGTKSYWEYIYINPEDILYAMYPNNPVFTKKILDMVAEREQYYLPGEDKQVVQLTRMIMEECRSQRNYCGEYLQGLLLSFIISIARNSSDSETEIKQNVHSGGMERLSDVLEYISRNYTDNIKVKTLAEFCNLSETHFRRVFSEYVNMSPMEYINLVRVQQACDMMQKTRYSMEDIALRVGFSSVSAFNRNFRKIIGTSPYQYKKNRNNYQGNLANATITVKDGW